VGDVLGKTRLRLRPLVPSRERLRRGIGVPTDVQDRIMLLFTQIKSIERYINLRRQTSDMILNSQCFRTRQPDHLSIHTMSDNKFTPSHEGDEHHMRMSAEPQARI
jgi:hypothetical protein